MTYSETIKVKIKSQGFSDITEKVDRIVRDSEVTDGICNIFAVGATAGILVNENEPMLLEDLKKILEKIADTKQIYQHIENAYSHIRSIITGNSQTIPVEDGKIVLGDWQSIMVFNFDTSEREREVIVTIIGD